MYGFRSSLRCPSTETYAVPCVEMRGVDRAKSSTGWFGGRPGMFLPDFRERRAAVPAHLQVPVVSPRPHNARHHRRFGDRDDRAVRRRRRRSSTAALTLPGDAHQRDGVAVDVLGQIVARDPRVALVVRLEQPVAAEPDDLRVVRRHDHRRVPVESIHVAGVRVEHVGRPAAAARRGSDLHRRRLPRLPGSPPARRRRLPAPACRACPPAPPAPPARPPCRPGCPARRPGASGARGRMLSPRPVRRSYRLVVSRPATR